MVYGLKENIFHISFDIFQLVIGITISFRCSPMLLS